VSPHTQRAKDCLGVKLRPNRERKNGAPLVCSSLKSCRGTPDQRSTRRSPDHLHHGVLGEAKVTANRTPREAGVCSSTSALNGRWRLISGDVRVHARGPIQNPLCNRGVFNHPQEVRCRHGVGNLRGTKPDSGVFKSIAIKTPPPAPNDTTDAALTTRRPTRRFPKRCAPRATRLVEPRLGAVSSVGQEAVKQSRAA